MVPISSPGTAPASVSNTAATFLAGSIYLAGTNTNITGESALQYVIYTAADSGGTARFYWLDLTPSSTPVPSVIGTFGATIPSGGTAGTLICDSSYAQGSVQQPQSMFALIAVLASGASCTATGATFTYYFVDNSLNTVTPVTGFTQAALYPIYNNSGALTAVANFNSSTHTLNLYAYTAGSNPFASAPTVALSNVNSISQLGNTTQQVTWYFDVTLTTSSTVHSVYELTSGSTSASSIYTETIAGTLGTGGASSINSSSSETDGTNMFFVDTATNGAQSLYQIGSTGALTLLYSDNTPATTPPLSLIASDGTHVLVAVQSGSSPITWTFYPLAVGQANQSLPSSTGLPYAEGSSASTFNGLATPGKASSRLVFVNWLGSSGGTTEKFSAILTPSGTVPLNTVNNSQFISSSLALGGAGGSVLQAQGITDAQANFIGGGSLYNVSLSSFSASLLSPPGGGTFTIPSTSAGYALNAWSPIGAGEFIPSGLVFIYNQNTNQIFTITEANTTLGPW